MKKRIISIVTFLIIAITALSFFNAVEATTDDKVLKIATVVTNNTKEKNPDDSNASLSKLVIDGYDLYPEFNKNTTKYYVSIPTSVKSIDVEAEAEVDTSSVKTTGNTALTKTENNVYVTVTAKDKTARRYTIVVTKQEDNGLKLSELSIENVEFETPFSEDKYYYNAKAEIIKKDEIPPFEIKATPNSEDAEVEILGNKNIKEGENLITILLKEGDDYTSYQVNVTVSTKTMITTIQEADGDILTTLRNYYDIAKEKVIYWFEDENRKLATIIASAVVLLIIIVSIIVKAIKKHKAQKKAEKIKRRAK